MKTRWGTQLARLTLLLLGVELLDELYSGVPSVAAEDIRSSLGVDYEGALLTLWFVPGVVALLVEPVLFVLADRHPRRWFVSGGLFAMGVAGLLAAWAPSATWLAVAVALAWVGSGSGVTLSEATLADAHPERRPQMLARWALLGEVGDLGAPLLVAGMAWLGLGWREAFTVVGVLVILWSGMLLFPRFPVPGDDDDEDEDEPLLVGVRAAFKNRVLLGWLGATALCEFLDELVVVFAALRMRGVLGYSPQENAWVIGAGVVGAIVGAAGAERVLRTAPPMRVLLVASVGAGLSLVGWLLAAEVSLSAVTFFCLGLCVAPMYPIANAEAYAALPDRSGTVNAARHVFTPVTLALPWALGALADEVGIVWAMSALLVQPLGLGVLAALRLARQPPRAAP
ncbi:MAG: sugar MFS transporter [Sandaracinaceae bacterium]